MFRTSPLSRLNRQTFSFLIDCNSRIYILKIGYKPSIQITINNPILLKEISIYFKSVLPNMHVRYRIDQGSSRITIDSLCNVEILLSHISDNIFIQKERIDLLKEFIKYRRSESKKRFDAIDEQFYKQFLIN